VRPSGVDMRRAGQAQLHAAAAAHDDCHAPSAVAAAAATARDGEAGLLRPHPGRVRVEPATLGGRIRSRMGAGVRHTADAAAEAEANHVAAAGPVAGGGRRGKRQARGGAHSRQAAHSVPAAPQRRSRARAPAPREGPPAPLAALLPSAAAVSRGGASEAGHTISLGEIRWRAQLSSFLGFSVAQLLLLLPGAPPVELQQLWQKVGAWGHPQATRAAHTRTGG
jgi:hypothetical protein